MRDEISSARRFAGRWVAALAAATALACAPETPPDEPLAQPEPQALPLPGAEPAADVITAGALEETIVYLGSDELEGRGPGSKGDELARKYLIERMQRLGLEPAASGGNWEQPFELVGINTTAPPTWGFVSGERRLDLDWWDDYIASSGVQQPTAAIDDAELVFVGYGIEAPEYGWDDFKGADLAGKVLLMLNNDPDWDPELFEGETRLLYGRWTYKYEIAAAKGAAGAIIMHTTASAGYPFQVVQTSWTGEQFEIPAGDEPRIQVAAWTSEDATRELVALAGRDLDELVASARSREFAPVNLGIQTSIRLQNEIRGGVRTANVLGRLPGRDPQLADEVVVYSAHHDHLGIGKPDASGDAIYNGALDNAAGVAQVLAIAEAFSALPEPPRRSILLAFVAAEEQGLLGSEYFSLNPTLPPGRIAANINYDGGNIWGSTRDVTFIGHGKSSLDGVVERYASRQGRTVKADQFPDRGYFYRSDQFHFARIGVPAIYLDTGTDFVDRPEGWGREQIEAWEAEHYHQPTDELTAEWNFAGMIADARLGFFSGLEIAEQPEMPAWNPGDEFETARQQALAELDEAGG